MRLPNYILVQLRDARDLFVSLRLTLALLTLSMVLVFAATLDQVNLGIWAVQEKYFRAFVIYTQIGGIAVPVFPGGYTLGGLLMINLLAAHVYRFRFTWRHAGIVLTHVGLIVLLLGELLSGLWQRDYHLRLDAGETKNYAESHRFNELAIVDASAPDFDTVFAIPDTLLAAKSAIQAAGLPFRVVPKTYYPNAVLQLRPENAGPDPATAGLGARFLVAPQPMTFNPDERNLPAAWVELVAPDRSLGTFLVSLQLAADQTFDYGGRTWRLRLRPQRAYYPFRLTLLQFRHERHAGTEIPKSFSSRVRLASDAPREEREILISMNEPLRHGGLTFYQAGFENNDRTTVLQVVRNPSWLVPYVACGLMGAGLLAQFGLHLFAFVRRPRGRPVSVAAPVGVSAPARPWLDRAAFPLSIAAVVLILAPAWRARPNPGEFDIAGFERLPALVNGRIKPLDTVARTSLLLLQGRQRVVTPAGAELAPAEWLLDLMFRPDLADDYPVFELVHPDVLGLMELTPAGGAGGKRFAMRQLAPRLRELDRQAKLAQLTAADLRSPFQRAAIKLRDSVLLYQRLQGSLDPRGSEDFLDQLRELERILGDASLPPADGPAVRGTEGGNLEGELNRVFTTMDAFSYLRPIPPRARDDATNWRTMGGALNESFASRHLDSTAFAYATLGRAWRGRDASGFNRAVGVVREQLERDRPAAMTKCAAEVRFNSVQPFFLSTLLYGAAFLLAVMSWLKWPGTLRAAALGVLVVAFVVTTAGIAARMWIESRPPVTNLYSSALFVGWGAVTLCIVLETLYRNAIAAAAAGVLGFATLLIAHHLALGGDTLEMMRAVLDSNFWLATHVVTVTIGYAATFLAGFLALIYVGRGLFTRTLDAATAASLARMIYGTVCFATLFSFVGTVLGGIWADQSWGRFWGWDPKENGALLIVMGNAIILHARWAGIVQQRGMAALAIFGNVVTAWSWFGVNMLGVGLHSYGFMDAAFWWLVAFACTQAAVIALAMIPTTRWRSFARGVEQNAAPE